MEKSFVDQLSEIAVARDEAVARAAKADETAGKLTAENEVLKASLADAQKDISDALKMGADKEAELTAKLSAALAEVESLKGKLALSPAHADATAGGEPVKPSNATPDQKTFSREQIARMTPAEYRANRTEILKAMNEGTIK